METRRPHGGKSPSTRIVDYSENPKPQRANPHSPWQLLVNSQRIKHDLDFRTLAQLIAKNMTGSISHSTLYNWVNSLAPRPTSKVYLSEFNTALAQALQIDPDRLAHAFNASGALPTSTDPAPADLNIAALEQLMKISTKATRTPQETLHAIRLIQDTIILLASTGKPLSAEYIARHVALLE